MFLIHTRLGHLAEGQRSSPNSSESRLLANDWGNLSAGSQGALLVNSAPAYQNTYSYDPTGNRILTVKDGARTTSTFDPANQNVYSESADGRTTYTFDQSGNRTGVEKPDGSRATTTYDYENRDILIVLPSGLRNTMAYDPDGRRVQLDDSSGTTKFLWDGNAYLLETNGSNIFTAVYTQEPSSYSKLVSQYRFDGSLWLPSYYHYDNLGSTSTLTDDTENITDTYEYDAFGNEVIRTGDTFNPFRWLGTAGYYFNVVTGTFYVFMRTYDPRTGTWTTLDILQFINGMNMYMAVFVPNGIDPSGMQDIDPFNTKPSETLPIFPPIDSQTAPPPANGISAVGPAGLTQYLALPPAVSPPNGACSQITNTISKPKFVSLSSQGIGCSGATPLIDVNKITDILSLPIVQNAGLHRNVFQVCPTAQKCCPAGSETRIDTGNKTHTFFIPTDRITCIAILAIRGDTRITTKTGVCQNADCPCKKPTSTMSK